MSCRLIMSEAPDKCCYEWHFEDVCFSDKKGFWNFVNNKNFTLPYYYRIDKNKGTELEKKMEENTFIWTSKNFDVFLTSSGNPLYDKKDLNCGGKENSVLIKKIDVIGDPTKVRKIATYLKQQSSIDPSGDLARKNVISIRNEQSCKKIL